MDLGALARGKSLIGSPLDKPYRKVGHAMKPAQLHFKIQNLNFEFNIDIHLAIILHLINAAIGSQSLDIIAR